ncbi:SusD/RagB family nutrient-binding outer membrane lipoprotein [uncultured Tenacibaculum sp.]|uniref:SusD/RagB family nutrient-binding outer membrane lipoprotein n=1 Tax=uncultured Tenacibaculum sp. TaxID=174713 RepID=UPI00262A3360|nr:SusD/RagB family nutrient-binding outer membrane lipoprotein [uncultured Tenacibaculum sp.]
MRTKFSFYIISLMLIFSCDSSFEDINFNKNNLTTDVTLPANLLIKGTMLADIAINSSHLQRISGMWSGQFKGEILLYDALHNYSISTEECDSAWGYLYNGILKQNSLIEESLPTEPISRQLLIGGISKIIETHAVGTATSIWGDIPYSDAITNQDNPQYDPKFDKQSDVYARLQLRLDEAITELTTSGVGTTLDEDIFFQGDPTKWVQVAYTLKARYYLQTKQYALAYNAALNGISSNDNTMKFVPPSRDTGAENLLYRFMLGRAGYMTTNRDNYSAGLLGTTASYNRNNAKTNEEARNKYYADTRHRSGTTKRITGELTHMYLVSYQENLLILAETGARTVDFNTGLNYLNQVRQLTASGVLFDKVSSSDILLYDDYVTADFNNGGIENADGIDATRALLREIIEERYVTGFGTFIPFNDARRLRKSDSDIAVPFPLNNNSVTQHPERFPYSQNAINANSNTPSNIDIYSVTEVNQ